MSRWADCKEFFFPTRFASVYGAKVCLTIAKVRRLGRMLGGPQGSVYKSRTLSAFSCPTAFPALRCPCEIQMKRSATRVSKHEDTSSGSSSRSSKSQDVSSASMSASSGRYVRSSTSMDTSGSAISGDSSGLPQGFGFRV